MAKKKVRVELRKNRTKPPRDRAWTQKFQDPAREDEAASADERVRAKGDLSRHRTIIQDEGTNAAGDVPTAGMPASDAGRLPARPGDPGPRPPERGRGRGRDRSTAAPSAGCSRAWRPTSGAWSRPATGSGSGDAGNGEGLIERVEPRHGVLTRASRRREHVLVANVDQLVIVMSLVEPDLKPHLIDRYLATRPAGRSGRRSSA